MRHNCYKSMVFLFPLVARTAAVASSSLRKPASAAFMLPLTSPLGLRAGGSPSQISPALRGGSGAQKGSILSASRKMRAMVSRNDARNCRLPLYAGDETCIGLCPLAPC